MHFTVEEFLDPAAVRIWRDRSQNLCVQVAGRGTWSKVTARLAFPYSDPDHYVVLATDEEEIGIVRDPAQLEPSSRDLLKEVLALRYYIPVIRRIVAVHETHSANLWIVETDRGPREFLVRDRHNFRRVPGSDLIIIDVDGNRFRVPREAHLDAQSRRFLDLYS